MPAIKHPGFEFPYSVNREIGALKRHRRHRKIPDKNDKTILLASWNLCNLGDPKQERSEDDLELTSEMLRPFDLIAVQEIKEDFRPFEAVVNNLGADFDYVMTDRAGNNERLAIIYDKRRVERLQLAAELVILGRERPTLTFKVSGKKLKQKFPGFNRNPYLCAFRADSFDFTLANVHIYYGAKSGAKFRRRVLEVYALARWAHRRVTKFGETTFDRDIILIGDFNVPKLAPDDKVARALRKFGMQTTLHSSFEGTNLSGRDQFDQIAFHPGETKRRFTGKSGVFDFDKAIFRGLWGTRSKAKFHNYVRYHISDHRLIWSQWRTR